MRHNNRWLGWLILMACFFCAGNTHADVIPPEVTACEKKAVGDTCAADSKTGTCQQSKCAKLDYSDGTPPTSKEYDCVKCVTGTPQEPAPSEAAPQQEAAPTDGSIKETTPPKTGGCSAFSWPGSSNASFFLACFVLFGIWLTRRSRRNT